LAIYGEQGSAKSTTTRIVRELVDPNVAPLRSEPREPRDLMVAASNGWIIALENLSSLSVWLSDALCRLATGGGFSARQLYTDGEEKLFDAQRPVLLNGIVDVVTRPDLADRAVAITLPSIPEENRRPESEFWPRFNAAKPRILGALLDAVSMAIRNLPHTRLLRLPRMADFALWASAAEPALGVRPGTFLEVYGGNRAALNETALESSPVVPHLFRLLEEHRGAWEGAAGQLLEALNKLAPDAAKRQGDWPSKSNALSGILRRIAPNLRQAGIDLTFDKRDPITRRKLINIRTMRKSIVPIVRIVQTPDTVGNPDSEGSFGDRSATFAAAPQNPRESGSTNGANDANDENPCLSDDAHEVA
jgi:hypothetical protein